MPRPASRVVIVDDHAGFRRAARALLELRGFSVIAEAECGATAQRVIAALRPDSVLLDVELGGECGFALADALVAAHPRLAVLLVSAADPADAACRALATGARGFLPKTRLVDTDLHWLLGPPCGTE